MRRRDFLRTGTAAALALPTLYCRPVEVPSEEAESQQWVEEQLGQLSLEEAVGQVICVAPEWTTMSP